MNSLSIIHSIPSNFKSNFPLSVFFLIGNTIGNKGKQKTGKIWGILLTIFTSQINKK